MADSQFIPLGITKEGHTIGERDGQIFRFDGNLHPYDGPIDFNLDGTPITAAEQGVAATGAGVKPEAPVEPPADYSGLADKILAQPVSKPANTPNTADYVVQPQGQAVQGAATPLSQPAVKSNSRVQVTKGTNLDESTNLLNESQANQEAGLQTALDAGRKAAAEKVGFLTEAVKQDKIYQAQELEREKVRQDKLREDGMKLESAIEDLSKTNIDPNRFYKNMDASAQVTAGIGIMLGSLGAALTGSQNNAALDIINQAVTRDIEAQKLDFERRKGIISAQSTLYGQNMAQFQDERSAAAATRAMLWSGVEKQMQLTAAKSESEALKGQYQKSLGEVQKQVALAKADFAKERADKMTIETAQATGSPDERNKAIGELRNQVKQDPELEDYLKTKQGVLEMNSYLKNGQPGLAFISLVAKGLQQGSFGKEMENMAKQQGLTDFSEDKVKKWFGNAKRGQFINSAMRALNDQLLAKEHLYKDKIELLGQQATSLGVKPTAILSGSVGTGLSATGDKRISE